MKQKDLQHGKLYYIRNRGKNTVGEWHTRLDDNSYFSLPGDTGKYLYIDVQVQGEVPTFKTSKAMDELYECVGDLLSKVPK